MIKMGEPDTEGNNEYCADYHKLQTLSPENNRETGFHFTLTPLPSGEEGINLAKMGT
jgi:hypothetical protein